MIFLNGAYQDSSQHFISHRNSGFTTAIGVFDSMLVKDGESVHLGDHYDRVIHDAKTVIGLTPELLLRQFEEICDYLLKQNNLLKGYARIRTTITGGIVNAPLAPSKKPTILVDAAASPVPSGTAVKCKIISDYPRIAGCILENCKRLDYSRSYVARRDAEKAGAQDAILTNTNGNAACGTTSNLFIEENGVTITPPLSEGVLAGVTRKYLVQEGVKEDIIPVERLKNADKIFLANSFTGLRPVTLLP